MEGSHYPTVSDTVTRRPQLYTDRISIIVKYLLSATGGIGNRGGVRCRLHGSPLAPRAGCRASLDACMVSILSLHWFDSTFIQSLFTHGVIRHAKMRLLVWVVASALSSDLSSLRLIS